MPLDQKNDWFNTAYWIAMHRQFFYNIVVFVLLFSNAVMWGYGGFNGFNLLLNNSKYNKMMETIFIQNIDYKGIHQSHTPKQLIISEESAMFSVNSNNKVDVIAKLVNPNPNWYISEISYQFIVNNTVGPMEKTFLLPSDDRFVASFLIPIKVDPPKNDNLPKSELKLSAKLNIKNISWKRLRQNPIKTPIFEFKNEALVGSRYTGMIINKSILSFWNTGIYMVRYGSDQDLAVAKEKIIGFKYLVLDNVLALKEQKFIVEWPADLRTSKTVLKAVTDPYDINNIIQFDQGEIIQTF